MVFPEELQQVDKSGVNVKLFNTTTGLTYNMVTDASGIAVANVEYGFYEAIAQKKYHTGSEVWLSLIHISSLRIESIGSDIAE